MRASLLALVLLSISVQPYLAAASNDVDPVIAILTAQVQHSVPASTVPDPLASTNKSATDTTAVAPAEDAATVVNTAYADAQATTTDTAASDADYYPAPDTSADAAPVEPAAEVPAEAAPPAEKRRLRQRDDIADFHSVEVDVSSDPAFDGQASLDKRDSHDLDDEAIDSEIVLEEIRKIKRDDGVDGGVEEAELGADEESVGDLFQRDDQDDDLDDSDANLKVRAAPFNSGQVAALETEQAAKREKRHGGHKKRGGSHHTRFHARANTVDSASSDLEKRIVNGTNTGKHYKKIKNKPLPSSSVVPTITPDSVASSTSVSSAPATTAPADASTTSSTSTGPALSTIAGALDGNGNPIVITVGAPVPIPSALPISGSGGTAAGVSWRCQTQYNPSLQGCTGTPVYNKRDTEANPNLDTDPYNCGSVGNVCYPEVASSANGNATCKKGRCKVHCNRHYKYSNSQGTCVLKAAWAAKSSKAAAAAASSASAASVSAAAFSAPPVLIVASSVTDQVASVAPSATSVPVTVSVPAGPALSTIAGAVDGAGNPIVITIGAALPIPSAPAVGAGAGGTTTGAPWLCQTQYNPTLKGCTGTPVYNRKRDENEDDVDVGSKMERRVRRG